MNNERVHALLPPGSRVLCAVSGGSDSICLLHLLWTERQDRGLEIFAAHYEHGLRGEDSLRDAAFVEAFCRERGIPCTVEHGDATAYAAEKRLGVEEAARELRYAFLERAADALGCDRIATAHNADDNAETLLMNLVRGSGLRGLGGIPPQRGRIVRPLLEVPREEIAAYLAENGLPHIEDLSNGDERFRRNFVRLRLMPLLREMNPGFLRAAGNTAALARQDEDCLQAQAEAFIGKHFRNDSVPVGELLNLHPAIASRVVRMLCEKSLEREHVEDVLSFCRGGGRGFLDLPGQRLRREQGRLYFAQSEAVSLQERELRPGETLEIPELGLRVRAELLAYGGKVNSLFKTYWIKYENIRGNAILCTGRRPGDRMRPAYRGCGKSLKTLFAEAGMTSAERDRALVFRDEAGILAVHDLAVDERSLPREGDLALRLTLFSMEDEG
jgi:tRNA(Ile)-lysidine synthase